MRTTRLLVIAGAAALTVLLGGCESGTSARTNPSGSTNSATSTASAPAFPAPESVGAAAGLGSAASHSPTSTVTRTGATAGCGAGLAQSWASWPMPNPRGSGLPNQASYTDLGNGSVKDNVTCMTWQKEYSPQKLTWQAAKSYCAGLNLAGGGWRLPTRVELTSIFDFTRAGPALDTTAFKGVANFFWTGSPWAVAHTPQYAWAMNFYEGLTTNAGNTDGGYFARCVRAPAGSGAPRYEITADEVTDPATGLVWQQGGSAQTLSATASAAYCAALTLGGQRWRLPSIKELATTVDESRVAPAINRAAFPGTARSTYYWSSSKAKAEPASTWGLNYDDGYTNYRNLTAAYTRCVR